MSITENEHILDTVEFVDEGHMADASAWTEEIAHAIAEDDGITLTDRHWLVINLARQEFFENDDAPTLRRITKETHRREHQGNVPPVPGWTCQKGAMIAGLPRSNGCI